MAAASGAPYCAVQAKRLQHFEPSSKGDVMKERGEIARVLPKGRLTVRSASFDLMPISRLSLVSLTIASIVSPLIRLRHGEATP
jgi:hypothetical protein